MTRRGEIRVPRDVLAALAASAHHRSRRIDPDPKNSGGVSVRWECAPDCPVCAAKELLGHGPDSPLI